jgi:hypothetical protein
VLCNSRGAECYSSLVCLKSVKYCELWGKNEKRKTSF